jgi:ribosomal protein S18 acetylase RimI-like enzyme
MPPARTENSGAGPRYRFVPEARDIDGLRKLVSALDVFYPEERAVALELLEERMLRGADSGYFFVFADVGGDVIGYAAWGPVPLTRASFDLYWIAVHPDYQRLGVGRALLALTEKAVAERGGGRLYIETSSREEYRRTRSFYVRADYREVARLEHFYAENDAKVVYCKAIGGVEPAAK